MPKYCPLERVEDDETIYVNPDEVSVIAPNARDDNDSTILRLAGTKDTIAVKGTADEVRKLLERGGPPVKVTGGNFP